MDALNTSNQRVRDLIIGRCKDEIPPTGTFMWVDVRDLALGHVKAMELPQAANQRFLFTAGHFSNREITDVIREWFPELNDKLPAKGTKGGDFPPEGIYKYDNSRSKNVLGIKFTSLEDSIVDLVKSLQSLGA
jgi:nucleoside-diphosphate-sugar epimerase